MWLRRHGFQSVADQRDKVLPSLRRYLRSSMSFALGCDPVGIGLFWMNFPVVSRTSCAQPPATSLASLRLAGRSGSGREVDAPKGECGSAARRTADAYVARRVTATIRP